MAACSVGKTRSGKTIRVPLGAAEEEELTAYSLQFSDNDKFDALLAIEYLVLRETRRGFKDVPWTDALNLSLNYFDESLSADEKAACRLALGIENAFQARQHGERIIHRHFRMEP